MMHPLLAYIGPDTMLPLASVLAAVIGGLLFCWRWVVMFVRRAFGGLIPGAKKPSDASRARGRAESSEPAGRPVAARTAGEPVDTTAGR